MRLHEAINKARKNNNRLLIIHPAMRRLANKYLQDLMNGQSMQETNFVKCDIALYECDEITDQSYWELISFK